MYEKLSELAEFFRAAVQDKPSAREKMGNLLDSLDVSRKKDRIAVGQIYNGYSIRRGS